MNKQWNRWLMPASFAVVLFLCIRVANDIPKREYYWEGNEWDFMLKDMLVVFAMSYPILFSMKCWLRFCRRKRLAWWKEYGAVFLATPFWCLLAMWIIRLLMGLKLDLYDVPIPVVVSILLGGFYYTFMRNRMIQKENEVQRLQLEKIKNDKLQTELKFLKAQYHPHFLFNALNTVYFQIDEKNEVPRRTLEILSDLLRYQLYNEGDKVTMRAEIEYLRKYISLWKLRSTERLKLQAHFDEALQEQEIYPLLFVPLVENAFKYVGGEYHIALDMRLKDGWLHFYIENSISAPLPLKEKQGIGIENLQRRLELLYPDCHTLGIKKEKTLFKVELVIKIDVYANKMCDNR